MKLVNYRLLLRKEPEGGYTVTVPVLPGCVTFGETVMPDNRGRHPGKRQNVRNPQCPVEKSPNKEKGFCSFRMHSHV